MISILLSLAFTGIALTINKLNSDEVPDDYELDPKYQPTDIPVPDRRYSLYVDKKEIAKDLTLKQVIEAGSEYKRFDKNFNVESHRTK